MVNGLSTIILILSAGLGVSAYFLDSAMPLALALGICWGNLLVRTLTERD